MLTRLTIGEFQIIIFQPQPPIPNANNEELNEGLERGPDPASNPKAPFHVYARNFCPSAHTGLF